jgi:23S rRNA U2552 (ribose-2'-O)-methylase RlmE/FtsJ
MIPIRNITDSKGYISSVYPATAYLTFGPWIYLVPQYVPKSVLMLGYAGGTTAGLIRLFYGDVPITGVDIEDCEDFYNVNLVKADARDYIKTCESFDTVIVDMFDDGDLSQSKFIYEQDFVDSLKQKANYIIVHTNTSADMSAYDGIQLIKTLDLNDARFYYYMVNDIPTLPIR